MSILNRIKLARAIMKFASVMTDQGELIYEGDSLIEGLQVYVETAEGDITQAPDGEYIAEDRKIVVADGVVASIEEKTESTESTESTETENLEENETENETEETQAENKDEKIAELEAKIAELQAAIEEKDAKIAELEGKLNSTEEELSSAKAKLKESADAPLKDKLQFGEGHKFTQEEIDANPALKYFL